jgi:hypothetical protein
MKYREGGNDEWTDLGTDMSGTFSFDISRALCRGHRGAYLIIHRRGPWPDRRSTVCCLSPPGDEK